MKPISHLRKASIAYNSTILEAMYLTIPINITIQTYNLAVVVSAGGSVLLQAAALLPQVVALFLQAAALLPQAVALFLQAAVCFVQSVLSTT